MVGRERTCVTSTTSRPIGQRECSTRERHVDYKSSYRVARVLDQRTSRRLQVVLSGSASARPANVTSTTSRPIECSTSERHVDYKSSYRVLDQRTSRRLQVVLSSARPANVTSTTSRPIECSTSERHVDYKSSYRVLDQRTVPTRRGWWCQLLHTQPARREATVVESRYHLGKSGLGCTQHHHRVIGVIWSIAVRMVTRGHLPCPHRRPYCHSWSSSVSTSPPVQGEYRKVKLGGRGRVILM